MSSRCLPVLLCRRYVVTARPFPYFPPPFVRILLTLVLRVQNSAATASSNLSHLTPSPDHFRPYHLSNIAMLPPPKLAIAQSIYREARSEAFPPSMYVGLSGRTSSSYLYSHVPGYTTLQLYVLFPFSSMPARFHCIIISKA